MKTGIKVKHTPGPWKIDETKNYANSGTIDVSKGNRVIASVLVEIESGSYFQRDVMRLASTEEMANARLISSAPELLTMLKRVLEEYLTYDPENGPVAMLTLEQAKKAIAKAEGKV